MSEQRCTGIVLRAINFKDHDRILSLYTREFGLIKLIVYQARSKRSRYAGLTEPLTEIEYLFQSGRGELGRAKDATLVKANLGLRHSLSALRTALAMCQNIQDSQPLEKPAPDLYELLHFCLKKLTLKFSPEILHAAFLLRILRHDGLLSASSSCSICATPLDAYFYAAGDAYCRQHAPTHSIGLTEMEATLIHALAHTKELSSLAQLPITAPLRGKVVDLFYNSLDEKRPSQQC